MSYINLLEEMFKSVTESKRSDLIEKYYHPDFKLYANGIEQEYADYYEGHKRLYFSSIEYQVEVDRETVLEDSKKAAMRVFITVGKPNDERQKIEVILIASFKDSKIYRLWETTFPDWAKLDYFKDY